MNHRWLGWWAACLSLAQCSPRSSPLTTLLEPPREASAFAQASAERETRDGGPYARIAILRPHDGHTVDFEAGYIRHLEWHRQARDTWVWYGWNVTFGERQRWFVYASFGHSAASLDSPVAPAEDERDNIANVTPHAQFLGNARLRVSAGAVARHGRADTDRSARVHDRGPQPRGGKGLRGGPRRGPINTAGRDTLVSDGGGWNRSALCPTASAAQPVGDSRWQE